MQVPDDDVERFLLQLTLLPIEEATAVAAAHRDAPERRDGQRRLAREVTTLVHGPEAAAAAEAASAVLFGLPLDGVEAATLETVAAEVPTTAIERPRLVDGVPLVDLLAEAGLTASRGEARRLLHQGGRLPQQRDGSTSGEASLGVGDLLHDRYAAPPPGQGRRTTSSSPPS